MSSPNTHYDVDVLGDTLVSLISEPVNWAIPKPGNPGSVEVRLGDSWVAAKPKLYGGRVHLESFAIPGKDLGCQRLAEALADTLDGLSFKDGPEVNEAIALEISNSLRRASEAS